ncbi:MAG: GyrI-like domain-containing protein [Bryobacterales bacterium]|nr:GyrI-like domain-containing protein [Bryobacterales bacterium]
MTKIDLKKERKDLYQPSPKAVAEVDVPPTAYLMIDGEGDPNSSQAYAAAVEALFSVSYAVKFAVKKGPLAIDYAVMPMEGLWWADDMSNFARDKTKWKWTIMIAQPAFVPQDTIRAAIEAVSAKKGLPALSKLRVETVKEGRCAQILHIGPFSEEGPAIEKVHAFIEANGKRLTGKHHEIYLSDIRKAAPSKWKTIIRQPMR